MVTQHSGTDIPARVCSKSYIVKLFSLKIVFTRKSCLFMKSSNRIRFIQNAEGNRVRSFSEYFSHESELLVMTGGNFFQAVVESSRYNFVFYNALQDVTVSR